jgi:protocatechuate 3,4-dioxygenase, alpha subunit
MSATPGQTVGPFFGYALPYDGGPDLVPPGYPGSIRLHGHVLDGAGAPVPDALLEIWQTDASGTVSRAGGSLRRDGHTFTGWGRAATDNLGHYTFTTVEPGTPFIALTVFARGLMNRLFTRIYLPEATDPFLLSVPAERRDTLVATRETGGLRFDVVLQGERETVFLTYPGHS